MKESGIGPSGGLLGLEYGIEESLEVNHLCMGGMTGKRVDRSNMGDVGPRARHLLMIGTVSGSSRNVVGRTSSRTIDCA
jgi:hypothetical protein